MLIRDCCTFVGLDDKFFRITVRSTKDNQKLVEAIKQIIVKSHFRAKYLDLWFFRKCFLLCFQS